MMDLIGGISVTLVVKAPNEKIADQTVECAPDWTIRKLKEHLADVYPNRPTETQQRIIYSGKLLQDHLVLKDVLKMYEENQTIHTVHLVCSSNGDKRREVHPFPAPVPMTRDLGTTEDTMPAATLPAPEGLRHRHISNQSNQQYDLPVSDTMPAYMENNSMYHPGNMMYPGMMNYSPEQMAWMQQMYAQQMLQYMQYYQQGGVPTPPPSPFTADVPVPGVAANQNEVNPVRANQRAAGAGNQPIRMNAQGGAVVDDDADEEGGNRDWLDCIYTMSRFAVLLSIVYFYSTFSRFMMVFCLSVVVYMYQGGWFALQRRRVREQQEEEEEGERPEQERVPEVSQQQVEGENTEAQEAAETTETTSEPPPPTGPGPFKIAWSFFSTFFTSLVPDQPPPVNIN